jgi:hypothetical protein
VVPDATVGVDRKHTVLKGFEEYVGEPEGRR